MIVLSRPRVSSHHWRLSAVPETRALAPEGYGGLSVWMLSEDLDHRHYAYDMGIEYDSVDHEIGDRVLSGLLAELGQYDDEDATRLFPELVSTVARDHLMYGKCMFELYDRSDTDTPSPRLGVLPGWSLRHRRSRTFQATPAADGLEWRQLPNEALTEFPLPEQLGKELYRIRKRLQVLDRYRPRDPDTLAKLRPSGYDFDAHGRWLDEMAARATKPIGWDGRGSFLDRATNSYRTYRGLRFLRTWLTIVSATTETLNRILSHPAVSTGTPISLRITGLPAIDDIGNHMTNVINGSESLDDIFDTVLHPRHH
jgi:hypothetical protein